MRPLVPTLNCVKLKDYLLVPVTIHTICMVLFMPTKTVGTHAATCDRVVLVFGPNKIFGPKNFLAQKKILVKKSFWSNKIFGQKNFW